MEQFIGFNIKPSQYMIPILNVREIISMPSITTLPHLPHYIKGITNLRGSIVPILNLRSLLNTPGNGEEGNTVIVLATGQITFGIMVDGITGVINASESEIEPPDSLVSNDIDSIAGVAKINNKLIVLLDIKKLLPFDDMSLLEDVVNVSESKDGESVEVTKELNTIGGKITISEMHDAKKYMADKLTNDDPNKKVFDLMMQFMDALSSNDYEKVEVIVNQLIAATDSNIFKEVGKITRKLHDSLEDFKGAIDNGLQKISENDVPNAVDKLQFVITKTEDAANKTMAIVERYFEEEDDFQKHIDNIQGNEEDVEYLKALKDAMDSNMTEILTAQQFQDITGQTIKKVINLVNSVESELLTLITKVGMSGNTAQSLPERVTYKEYAKEEEGVEPGDNISQSDVESLLDDFGF